VIADVCILYCAADTGSGPDPRRGCVVIVPMDAKACRAASRSTRSVNGHLTRVKSSSINVKLTKEHLLAGPDQYLEAVYAIHTFANALMVRYSRAAGAPLSSWRTPMRTSASKGVCRSSATSRSLTGVPHVPQVEAARALTHRVVHYNFTSAHPSLHAAMTAKITATQTSFEVANDALQIFCGNGLTREYPIEKILRDARASLVEDGCNEILAIKGGYYLIDPDLL